MARIKAALLFILARRFPPVSWLARRHPAGGANPSQSSHDWFMDAILVLAGQIRRRVLKLFNRACSLPAACGNGFFLPLYFGEYSGLTTSLESGGIPCA